MSSSAVKMQPWQVFHAANKYLGPEKVAQIWNREKRSAYSWAQDPAYTGHRCNNPLELLHAQFTKMDDAGIGYVAKAGIMYLESALDSNVGLADMESIEPLPTVVEEELADFRVVGELHAAIAKGYSLDEIKIYAARAIAEIERTVAKVAMERKK